jgi:O-antigen ligase
MRFVTPAAWFAALFLATTLFSHTVALRLLLLFGGLCMVAAAAVEMRFRARNLRVVFAPPLLLPFALWAAWAVLSMLWSLDAELTGKELRNEIGYALLSLCICYVGAQASNAARIFLPVMALAAVGVSAVALRYLLFGIPESPAWPHGGPGTYSAALLVLFPCTLAFAWLAVVKRWHPGLIAAAAALIALYAVSGYGTQNRTLWIGFAVQIGIASCFLLMRPSRASARGWRKSGPIVVAAALAIGIFAAIGAKVQSERFGADAAMLKDDPRPQLWRSVLTRIESRPLAGSGFGRGMVRHELRDESGNSLLWHSHNLVLDMAIQLGAVGVALFALLIGWTAWLGWRLMRATDEVAAACGIALLAVVAGMLIRNMTDVLWVRQSALLYWGVVGALLGWGTRAAARPG